MPRFVHAPCCFAKGLLRVCAHSRAHTAPKRCRWKARRNCDTSTSSKFPLSSFFACAKQSLLAHFILDAPRGLQSRAARSFRSDVFTAWRSLRERRLCASSRGESIHIHMQRTLSLMHHSPRNVSQRSRFKRMELWHGAQNLLRDDAITRVPVRSKGRRNVRTRKIQPFIKWNRNQQSLPQRKVDRPAKQQN